MSRAGPKSRRANRDAIRDANRDAIRGANRGANRGGGHNLAYFVSQCLEIRLC